MRQHLIEIAKGGLIAGTISAIISFLLNYYLLPFPETLLDNAVGHGIGGFIAGFISACMGITVYILHHRTRYVLSSNQKEKTPNGYA